MARPPPARRASAAASGDDERYRRRRAVERREREQGRVPGQQQRDKAKLNGTSQRLVRQRQPAPANGLYREPQEDREEVADERGPADSPDARPLRRRGR